MTARVAKPASAASTPARSSKRRGPALVQHRGLGREGEPKLNRLAPNIHDGHFNVVIDDDRFANLAGQIQHRLSARSMNDTFPGVGPPNTKYQLNCFYRNLTSEA